MAQRADDCIPLVMALGPDRVTLYSRDAVKVILWVAQHQTDLEHKGAWTFDHAPGSLSVTRTTKEPIE